MTLHVLPIVREMLSLPRNDIPRSIAYFRKWMGPDGVLREDLLTMLYRTHDDKAEFTRRLDEWLKSEGLR